VSRLATLMVVLPLFLAACGGSLFQSKRAPPTTYLLSVGGETAATGTGAAGTAAAGTPGVEIPVDLAILKPRARAGLDTDRVAALYPDRRLDYFAAARWSGSLDEVVQDLAVQAFHAHANLRNVGGDASVFASAYWLEIEIIDFQAEYLPPAAAPRVHVHFLARLGGSGDRRILGRFEANTGQTAADNRLSAIVDAYARAADLALAEIVADTVETLGKYPQGPRPSEGR
jgi:ABC-type uncharacterized transport system auxiliary subunit